MNPRFLIRFSLVTAFLLQSIFLASVQAADAENIVRLKEVFAISRDILDKTQEEPGNEYYLHIGLNNLSGSLAHAGLWDEANEAVKLITDPRFIHDHKSAFAIAKIIEGDFEAAFRYINDIPKQAQRNSPHGSIVRTLHLEGHIKDIPRYLEFLDSAMDRGIVHAELAMLHQQSEPSLVGTHAELALAEFATVSDLDQFSKMAKSRALSYVGRFEEAKTIVDETFDFPPQRVYFYYETLAKGIIYQKAPEQLEKLLAEIKKTSSESDSYNKTSIEMSYGKIQYISGNIVGALKTFDEIAVNGDEYNTNDNNLWLYSHEVLAFNDYDFAMEMFSRVTNPEIKEKFSLNLIDYKLRQDGADLEALLQEALEFKNAPLSQSSTIAHIAVEMARSQ